MLSKVGALEKNENKTRKRRADYIGEAGGGGGGGLSIEGAGTNFPHPMLG